MPLHDLLLRSAARTPDAVCLVHNGQELTYAQVGAGARQLANLLIRSGVAPGDRVAIHLDKSAAEVTAILAVSMAGAVSVNVNALLKGRQVRHILADSGAVMLITSYPRLKSLGSEVTGLASLRTIVAAGKPAGRVLPVGRVLRQVPIADPAEAPPPAGRVLRQVPTADPAALPAADPANTAADLPPILDLSDADGCDDGPAPVRRIDRDLAAIIYTSGSTGLPKGVVLSHRNLVAGAESVSTYLQNTSDDRILSILPFSFDYGLNQLTTSLLCGATLVLKTHLGAADTLRTLEAERITGLAGIPTLWSQLLHADWTGIRLPALRYITNSGGRFAEQHVREYRQRLPHTRIFLMYGLTEAFRSTYLDPEQVDVRPSSIGKAIPNAEVLVINDDGRPCRPNEVGELVHRGAHVAQGYWNEPELTALRFRRHPLQHAALPQDEWVVYSGDLVRQDEEGYLYYIGRRDQMIKTSGFRVSPTEIEEYFYNTGLVLDCVAFSVPDPELGERIKVTLSLKPDVTMTGDALLATVARRMPTFMVPKDVQIVDGLPKTASGKIDRPLVCAS